jgi:hypothetical protein
VRYDVRLTTVTCSWVVVEATSRQQAIEIVKKRLETETADDVFEIDVVTGETFHAYRVDTTQTPTRRKRT